MSQGAYVGSFAACDVEVDFLQICLVLSEIELQHVYAASCSLYNFALPGALIQPFALDPNG